MRKKLVLLILTIIIVLTSAVSCGKKQSGSKESKALNIYVDVKDKNSLDLLKYLIDEYKKENTQGKVNLNSPIGGKNTVAEDISKGTEGDVVVTSRGTMMDLAQRGLLSDMGTYYEKQKIREKYSEAVSAYGRVGDRYYGIAINPFTIEIFYNRNALNKLGISSPVSLRDMRKTLKKLNSSSVRVPVILTEDLDVNLGLSSIIANNIIKTQKLETAYDSKNAYLAMPEMQTVFDYIYSLVSDGTINKNTFELGNDNTINNLIKGTVPVIIATSYYNESLENHDIGIVSDYSINNTSKDVIPLISDSIICIPTSGKNAEEAGKLIKFIFSDETQQKLVKKGYVTGNKTANEKLTGNGKFIAEHMAKADDNSVLYAYNLPKKLQSSVSARINDILSGKYTKHEWQDAVNEVFK